MFEDLKSKLAAIAKRPPHWTETRIGRWDGGIVAEAEWISNPDWWKRDSPGSRDLAAVNELLERVGVGKLRDGKESENTWGKNRGSTPSDEVSEHQRNQEKNSSESASANRREHADDDELAPGESESIVDWFGRLGKAVDFNGRDKLAWDALRSYASRFRGDVSAKKNFDAKVVSAFLKNIRRTQ
jgi:hypothetical protein